MTEDMTSPGPGPGPFDEGTADALAIAHAVRTDDIEALAAVLEHANLADVAVSFGKLLAEVADELRIAPCDLRLWAVAAVRSEVVAGGQLAHLSPPVTRSTCSRVAPAATSSSRS